MNEQAEQDREDTAGGYRIGLDKAAGPDETGKTPTEDCTIGTFFDRVSQLPCGCRIRLIQFHDSEDAKESTHVDDFKYGIVFCPLHNAAEELKGVCEMIAGNGFSRIDFASCPDVDRLEAAARAALALAEPALQADEETKV